MTRLLGTQIPEALYVLECLHASLHLDGDVCEFGVAQGRTSALLAHEIMPTSKRLWLYDSFRGLPEPSDKDHLKNDIFGLGSMRAYKGTMSCPRQMVEYAVAETGFPDSRVSIVEGFIKDTISPAPQKVCFAYVDFDFYEPIATTLAFLDNALVRGGSAVIDDYDFFSTGAKTAVDEFLSARSGHYQFRLPVEGAGHFCILRRD